MNTKPLTIGQLARQGGVGVETVRFYERLGLIDEPPRRASGYREYPLEVVSRLRFIKNAKDLGFSLKEIKELLLLRRDPDTTCADIKARATAKMADIDDKISDLKRIKKALVKVSDACTGRGPTSDCPILDALTPRKDD